MSVPQRKRLTEDERDRIVELRLNGVPVRTVATQVGTTTKTVQATWQRWLRDTAEERSATLEAVREELIQRMTQVADDARRGHIRARADGDVTAAARWLAEERQALRELARIQGLDVQKVELSGAVGVLSVTLIEEVAAPTPVIDVTAQEV
jgi:transposase-like protein